MAVVVDYIEGLCVNWQKLWDTPQEVGDDNVGYTRYCQILLCPGIVCACFMFGFSYNFGVA